MLCGLRYNALCYGIAYILQLLLHFGQLHPKTGDQCLVAAVFRAASFYLRRNIGYVIVRQHVKGGLQHGLFDQIQPDIFLVALFGAAVVANIIVMADAAFPGAGRSGHGAAAFAAEQLPAEKVRYFCLIGTGAVAVGVNLSLFPEKQVILYDSGNATGNADSAVIFIDSDIFLVPQDRGKAALVERIPFCGFVAFLVKVVGQLPH